MTRCRVSSNTWIYRSTRRRLAEQRSSGRGTCSPPPSLTQTSRFVPEIWMAERTLARSGSMISLRQLKTKIICSLTRFNRTVTGLVTIIGSPLSNRCTQSESFSIPVKAYYPGPLNHHSIVHTYSP